MFADGASDQSNQAEAIAHRVMALKGLRSSVSHTLREPDFLNKKAALTQRADKTFAPLGAQQTSFAFILPS